MSGPQRKLLGIDFSRVDTNQEHELGIRIETNDGKAFRYVRAGAAIALGDALIQDFAEGTWDFAPSAAADTPIYGVWPNENVSPTQVRAAVPDNAYFWMQVGGDALVKAAATVVVGAPAVTVATAGTLDDTAATAANALAAATGVGAVFVTVTTAGFARVALNG